MHTVELLDEALRVAETLGYKIRQEYLGGAAGGACEIGGQKWLFVDLAFNASEQLDQVAEALRTDQGVYGVSLSLPLARMLGMRRVA
ncbi:MAG: hypothetical protein KDA60_05180 [Planctomycetales bacterium]|nr:hypothetical protein [Planctomycetales bacterium]